MLGLIVLNTLFYNRIVHDWNNLPSDVVDSDSLMFKTRMKKILKI